MTEFARLLAGGESEIPAVVPGKPEESYLIDEITPLDGEALMPQDGPPLHEAEIDLIRTVDRRGGRRRHAGERPGPIQPGESAGLRPPAGHRPRSTSAPTARRSPSPGSTRSCSSRRTTGERTARLIGLSERIESVAFSPDGRRLAVTGGLPGRMGEVQIWDVAAGKLVLSVPVTYDTVYGASWSPDGSKVAFGCGDNTVRAIDAKTGEEVLFLLSHEDWALDTVFSTDGSHLVSVGRDRAVKLIEVETQRFVDNITSITPGALKGGVQAVARHPDRDEVVVGGADGVPKLYRMDRLTKRVIGDDANLIREFPAMRGRIFDVDVRPDGSKIAAVSSLDGEGEVAVFAYDFDTSLPDDIKTINEKVVTSRSAEEKAQARRLPHAGRPRDLPAGGRRGQPLRRSPSGPTGPCSSPAATAWSGSSTPTTGEVVETPLAGPARRGLGRGRRGRSAGRAEGERGRRLDRGRRGRRPARGGRVDEPDHHPGRDPTCRTRSITSRSSSPARSPAARRST